MAVLLGCYLCFLIALLKCGNNLWDLKLRSPTQSRECHTSVHLHDSKKQDAEDLVCLDSL